MEEHEEIVPTVVDSPDDAAETTEDEEFGGGGNGRFITAIGAAVLLVGMFLSWYEVVRANGYTVNTTGWQTFTHLRFALLAGAIGCLASVFLRQTRLVVIGRIVVGIVASALVIRRIVSPPDLPGATLTAQLGIYVSLLGALGIAFGGLLGLGTAEEDEDELDTESGAPLEGADEERLALPEGTANGDGEEIVDADVVHSEPAGETSSTST